MIYNDVEYSNNEKIEIGDNIKNESSINIKTSDKNKKTLNVDTSSYKKITYNKKELAVQLFNEFDKKILSISKDIERNYLIKNVVYRLNKKILEVQINQSDILISFHKDIKQFDNENRLLIRKGYENSSLCYYIKTYELKDLDYIVELCNKLYSYIITPKTDLVEILFDNLSNRINNISPNITSHITNKGLMYKNKRNFTILSKKKYGIYVRLLNVEDTNNTLSIVGRTNYEPLCRYFKVLNLDDIDTIMPYIIKSYELSKYNPIDLKNDFINLYYTE